MRANVIAAIATRPALMASFGRAAKTYRQHASVQRKMAAWLADWLPVQREGRALELGAGAGVFTEYLLPWRGSLVATDISPAMCVAGRLALPQVAWRTMSAEAPDAGPWDWIFSSSMLQWAADPAQIFAAWRRQLAPGGRVLASLFAEDTLAEFRALAGEETPLAWRSVEAWRAELERGGLTVRRDAVERQTIVYASARALLRNLHAVGAAPRQRLGVGRMRRFLQDYECLYAAPGGVRATWTFYRFEAEVRGT